MAVTFRVAAICVWVAQLLFFVQFQRLGIGKLAISDFDMAQVQTRFYVVQGKVNLLITISHIGYRFAGDQTPVGCDQINGTTSWGFAVKTYRNSVGSWIGCYRSLHD